MTKGPYLQRYTNLLRLGFSSYDEYLSSPLWKGIRKRQLTKHRRCYGCGMWAYQVHHHKYTLKALRGKDSKALVSLCRDCHRGIEYFTNGRKVRTLEAVNRRLKALRSAYRRSAGYRWPS